ncbi:Hypothetical protein A7982_05477 [Minicystis rosea]|nr:Hypothetical protein A7982_05477 [Minicystis rosea]
MQPLNRPRSLALLSALVGGTSMMGCTLLAGLTEDYHLASNSGGMGGTGTTTSSSSSSTGSVGGGGATTSSSSSGGGGTGGATSSSSTGGTGGATASSSSSSSSGTGGTGGGTVTCEPNQAEPCYTGAPGTENVGVCHGGMKTCNAQGNGYGPCQGEVTPTAEKCSTPVDDDCDGTALDDDVGCVCLPGTSSPCYSGPGGTENVGICKAGTATCNADGKGYGTCVGEVLPKTEDCTTTVDDDCDGVAPPCLGGEIWSKQFGDTASQIAKSIAVLSDGTSFVTGTMGGTVDFGLGPLVSPGGTDAFLAKVDPMGNTLWAKRFGDSANQDARAVAVDGTGAAIVTGQFAGTIDFGGGALTSAGGTDVFLAKFDAGGTPVWSKIFGNSVAQLATDVTIVPGSNDIVISGYMVGSIDFGGGTLTSAGSNDLFVARFGPDGSYKWGKVFGNASAQVATSVAAQTNGDVVLVGYFQGGMDFGPGPLSTAGLNDIFMVTLNSAGDGVWSKKLGDASDQFAQAVAVGPQGKIAITGSMAGTVDFGGTIFTSAGGNDAFVAVYDSGGILIWCKKFGDTAEQFGYGVSFDSAGNVIVTGSFAGSANFTGQILTSTGGQDAFIAKFDPSGNGLWSKKYGDGSDQSAYAVGTDGSKNVYAAGSFAGMINFGNGNHTSAGVEDIFLAKLFP